MTLPRSPWCLSVARRLVVGADEDTATGDRRGAVGLGSDLGGPGAVLVVAISTSSDPEIRLPASISAGSPVAAETMLLVLSPPHMGKS